MLASRYRSVLADPTIYAPERFLLLTPAHKTLADRILRRDVDPRSVDAAAARPDVRDMLEAGARFELPPIPGMAVMIFYSTLMAVALAGLVAALATRGAILRLLGFEIVTADGRLARRWRVLARAAIAWSPILVPLLATGVIEGIGAHLPNMIPVFAAALAVQCAGAIVAIAQPCPRPPGSPRRHVDRAVRRKASVPDQSPAGIGAAGARVILPVRSRHPPADTVEAHMTSRPFLAAAAALLLTTLDAPSPLLAQSAPAPTPGKPVMGAFGIDTAQMDTSVKPGDDFFKYVNGKWLATFKMPADKASYGAFDLLSDKSEDDVRTLLGRARHVAARRRARSARRSSTSTSRGWTKPRSRRAASPRSRPTSTPSRPRRRRPTSRA